MTLRGRMAAVAGLAVGGVVIALAISVYVADRGELRRQVDHSLSDIARPFALERHLRPVRGPGGLGGRPFDAAPEAPRPQFGGPAGYVQMILPDGTVNRPPSETRALPPDPRALAVARSGQGRYFSDRTVNGVHLRVLTVADADTGAVQVVRPLTEVDHALDRLLFVLAVVGLVGIALAALLGAIVARAALAPIARFTKRTEALTADPDPSQRLEAKGRDELARLAQSFNATLDALERSVQAQRHLVADASHELRTPIASLRANIQVLGDADRLSEADRASLRADIIEELDALTALVADVVDLARGAQPHAAADDVSLDRIVDDALGRARRRAPGVHYHADLEPTLVRGTPEQIDRAATNLLDNAAKWSPDGGEIEVTLKAGVLSVRDHGPGIDEQDLPHVFDRFYRAVDARKLPGSGLGLAIVRQVAEAHGGYARASNDPGGGARLEVSFGSPTRVGDDDPAVLQTS
ncbi:MAG: two-component system, OmpR family, sensor histidine kinase MprB [Thermoleophilaceae bacterium]|nr:two-component system, OmpR family, sensor histidine kinase MprB [Thermoleophilaceae bacterium]